MSVSNILIFPGQGTTAAKTLETRDQALRDASSNPSASILLSACHDAFHAELNSLPPDQRALVNVDAIDFSKREDLLRMMTASEEPQKRGSDRLEARNYAYNPVVSGSALFLTQALRYLTWIEGLVEEDEEVGEGAEERDRARGRTRGHRRFTFEDLLKRNVAKDVGLLGFSSGILLACVVACSPSLLSFLGHAVEAYRLALWIGIRTQLAKVDILREAPLSMSTSDSESWALIVFGMDKATTEAAVAAFTSKTQTYDRTSKPSFQLYVTAIMNDTCVTISGRPDVLDGFYKSSPFLNSNSNFSDPPVIMQTTTLDTIYHSRAIHGGVGGTRAQVMNDVERRGIKFPSAEDLIVPVRSTISGDAITPTSCCGTPLVELVVDMVLVNPVNWDLVVSKAAQDLFRSFDEGSHPGGVCLLNVGPGSGLSRGVAQRMKGQHGRGEVDVDVTTVDLSMGVADGYSLGRGGLRTKGGDYGNEDEERSKVKSQGEAICDSAGEGKRQSGDSTATKKVGGEVKRSKLKQEPIAVVGMAVNMPGAPNKEKLWEVLELGMNTLSQIPGERFEVANYQGSRNSGRVLKATTGNFIDGVDEFDNSFFEISPREAKNMDPQQRILLQTAYHALEDAGYVPNATPTSNPESIGCYIGVATHDYALNLRNDVDVYYSTGTLSAFLSGRVSYAMKFGGPSVVVDTACSSSTVALYQGARALMNGDCDAALVGGVNVMTSPDMFIGLDRAHFLSSTGACKAFDSSADGYSRSEGCGVFVLKRLSDAELENDSILAVIRGVEVNQSGQAQSITHPHAPTQIQLFEKLLRNAKVEPDRISVVEAHGTGTQAGDPCEMESIRSVFAASSLKRVQTGNSLHVTSIKANIGHLEAASGAAGLAKIILMLQKQTIPRQILLNDLNPRIAPLGLDGTMINDGFGSRPWKLSRGQQTRMAVLNNFGAAGSNAAVLVEEYRSPTFRASLTDRGADQYCVFGISAKDPAALEHLRERYIEWLQGPEARDLSLFDIAYTATARRQIYDHRLAIAAKDREGLIEGLSHGSIEKVPRREEERHSPQVVFVFSGQGSQYLNMGEAFYRSSEVFRRHVDYCHEFLVGKGFPGVLPIILAGHGGDKGSGLGRTEEIEAYHAVIFVVEFALAKMWIGWGVRPAAVLGHSLGEYAALVIADVLTLEDALTMVAHRARLMVHHCPLDVTGMLAITLDAQLLQEVLDHPKYSQLSIACYNSDINSVVSGPLDWLHLLKRELENEFQCRATMVNVPFGHHSAAMDPTSEELTRLASSVTFSPPTVPVLSNVLGRMVSKDDGYRYTPRYFAEHCAGPVRFAPGVEHLTTLPDLEHLDIWIEIGPHISTLSMLRDRRDISENGLFLPSMRKGDDGWKTISISLAQLYKSNLDVQWREVFAEIGNASCIHVPLYPFARTKHWVAYQERSSPNPLAVGDAFDHSMLNTWSQYPSFGNDMVAEMETPITSLGNFILGHVVAETPLCPASVYIELALVAIERSVRRGGSYLEGVHVVLHGTQFLKPLVYGDESVLRTVFVRVSMAKDKGTYVVGSRPCASSSALIHAKGEYTMQCKAWTSDAFTLLAPQIKERLAAVVEPENGEMPEVFSRRTAYEVIFSRVVDYGKQYHAMQCLTVNPSGMEGCAVVKIPLDQHCGIFIVPPVFTDTLLHVAGFIANLRGGIKDAFICNEVGSFEVVPEQVDPEATYHVYCKLTMVDDPGAMVAEAYAVEVAEPRRVVAYVKDMRFLRVRLASLKRGLAHALGGSEAGSAPVQRSMGTRQSRSTSSFCTSGLGQSQDIQVEVIRILADACNIEVGRLSVDSTLSSLGVDSLLSLELVAAFKKAFPSANFDLQMFLQCGTVLHIAQTIAAKLDHSRSPSSPSSPSPPHVKTISGISSPRTLAAEDPSTSFVPFEDMARVKSLLASVLEIPLAKLNDEANLRDLGLDSLASIEIFQALGKRLRLELPQNLFGICPTLRSLAEYLALHVRIRSGLVRVHPKNGLESPKQVGAGFPLPESDHSISGVTPILVQQSRDSGRHPLFLIHDGSGLSTQYNQLLSLDRPVWSIQNPRFDSSQPWDSLTQMASAYAFRIMKQTSSPIILGGWSFGGVVAYEAALHIQKLGGRVAGVVLVDSPCPINHVPLSPDLINAAIRRKTPQGVTADKFTELVRAQFVMNSQLLGAYDALSTAGNRPPAVLLRSEEGFRSSELDNVPTWLSDREAGQGVEGWQRLSSIIKVIDIPGDHFQAFDSANISIVSDCIAKGCDQLSEP